MQSRYIALATAVGAIIIAGALVYFTRSQSETAPAGQGAQGQTIDLSKISTTTNIGGYTITPVPVGQNIQAPNYKKPIVYSASISGEAKLAIADQFDQIQAALDKDSMDFNSWMRLGTLKKIAGDYAGAAEVWAYAGIQWESYIPHANLGDLYLNFMHEPAKAEAEYKKALALNPPPSASGDIQAGLKAAQQAQGK